MNYYIWRIKNNNMETIDITIAKNKLQILILQAQENIKEKATNNRLDALDTLTEAYKTIVYLQNSLEQLKRKHLESEQNNIKAYIQNKRLKQKFSKFV